MNVKGDILNTRLLHEVGKTVMVELTQEKAMEA